MSNKYVIIGSPSKQLYGKYINGNTLNGNLDSNLDYSAYWNRPEYKDVHSLSRVSINIGTPSFDYGEVINGEYLENNNTDNSYITISKTPLGQVHFSRTTYFYNGSTLVSIVGGTGDNYDIYSSQSFNKDKYYVLTNIIEKGTGVGIHSHSLDMRKSISYRPLFKVA